MVSVEARKRAAAARAITLVEPGMRLGLGTGSTAKHFVELLGERVRGGLNVIGVPDLGGDAGGCGAVRHSAVHARRRRRNST